MNKIKNLVFSSILLAIALFLPMLLGNVLSWSSMLSLMHIPILICGLLCGAKYAGLIGFVAPFLKMSIYSVPPLYPVAIAMSFELCAYGLLTGLLYKKKTKPNLYKSLILSMIGGRIVYGLITALLLGLKGGTYTFTAFISSVILGCIPGILLHILLIPIIVLVLEKNINFAD